MNPQVSIPKAHLASFCQDRGIRRLAVFGSALRPDFGPGVVRTIEGIGPPYGDSWERWRPDPSWPILQLPDDWSDIDRSRGIGYLVDHQT